MGIFALGFIAIIASFIIAGLDRHTPETKSMKPISWLTRVVGVVLMVVGVAASAVRIIPAGYTGVLMRFGAVQGQLPEGIHMIMPGVNTIELMELRTQKVESRGTAASRDLQVVTTDIALNYRVNPMGAGQLYKSVGPDYKVRIIDPAVQESLKVVTARYTAEDLIRQRANVKSEIEGDITKRLSPYNVTVEPNGLSITNFDFSPEFNKAIEAKQVAQQESEKQKYILARAELERQTAVATAKGRAEAARLNAAALNVQGGELVIAKEWIDRWDGTLPQVSSGGNFIIDLKSLLEKRKSTP